MSRHTWRFIILSLTLSALARVGPAADYNIRLLTDSTPDTTDIASFVRSITANFATPQDKAIAIWRWGRRARHQTSCAWDRGRLIWDPVLHYTSYGYMNCGIISALNITCALQAGFKGRYIQLGDHTVSEFSWDDGASWHLFDSSMSIYCFNHEGHVASCEEIKAAGACELSGGKREAGHLYFYHPASSCASHLGATGWRCASDNPVEYQRTLLNGASSYTSGYSVSRYSQMAQWGRHYILNVKPGQTYTRHWTRLGTGPGYRRAARGEKDVDDPQKNAITRAVRAGGRWTFRPDLASPRWEAFVHDHAGVTHQTTSPYLVPRRHGETARVVFKVDAANVITSLRITGRVRCAGPGSSLRLLVSRDAGLAWTPVWTARGTGAEKIDLDLIDPVAGHTEGLLKFEMATRQADGICGLASLHIETLTQLNRLTLPKLVRGRNRVQVRLGAQEENLVFWPVLHADQVRETALGVKAIYTRPETDSFYKATLGAGANDTPCHVTWRLPVPTEITAVTVGARVCNRGGGTVSLQTSWDGNTFQEIYRKADGSEPFDRMVLERVTPPVATRCVWVRVACTTRRAAGTYNTPGIQDIFIRVAHRPRAVLSGFQPLRVTYAWTEHRETGDVSRQYAHRVTAPAEEWAISVGGVRDPTMRWVRMELDEDPAPADETPLGYADGDAHAGDDVDRSRVVHRWGRNLARGAPYTVSRPAGPANGDTGGGELTNGIVIAPTTRFASDWPAAIPAATAGWDAAVTIDVDLGKARPVAGVRVSTHQPDARVCHPARVDVSVSVDGQTWREVGTIRHGDLWHPPGDYEPWEYDDDPRHANLPAAGRLAYAFPLVFAASPPLTARHVRFRFTPLAGRGLGISELQVYDQVTTKPWPGDIAMPPVTNAR